MNSRGEKRLSHEYSVGVAKRLRTCERGGDPTYGRRAKLVRLHPRGTNLMPRESQINSAKRPQEARVKGFRQIYRHALGRSLRVYIARAVSRRSVAVARII